MTPAPGTKEAVSLTKAVRDGRIRAGDIFCHRNGERGWLNAAIRGTQRLALLDLNPKFDPARVAVCSEVTHVSLVVQVEQPNLEGVSCIAEQYAPHARFRTFEMIAKGEVIIVKRLRDSENQPARLALVIDEMKRLAVAQEPYPVRELFYYWFRWGGKLRFKRKFARVFRDSQHNVCSGAVIQAARCGGWFVNGEWTEAYYPARICIDTEYTAEVGVFQA
jgi:hypothetical protein